MRKKTIIIDVIIDIDTVKKTGGEVLNNLTSQLKEVETEEKKKVISDLAQKKEVIKIRVIKSNL